MNKRLWLLIPVLFLLTLFILGCHICEGPTCSHFYREEIIQQGGVVGTPQEGRYPQVSPVLPEPVTE